MRDGRGTDLTLLPKAPCLPTYPMVLTRPDKRGRDEQQQGPAGCDTATGNRKIAGVLLCIPTLTHGPYRDMCVRSLHGGGIPESWERQRQQQQQQARFAISMATADRVTLSPGSQQLGTHCEPVSTA